MDAPPAYPAFGAAGGAGTLPVAKQSNTVKWLAGSVALLGALFLGLLVLVMMGFSTGLLGMSVGMTLAVLPAPVYVLLALWIDRFEKEPVWMLAAAFIWGATVAVFFAYILNTTFAIIMVNVIGSAANTATAVFCAPLIEEFSKGLALIIFFFWQKDEFDNVLDGIIYAAMVGLGFALTENIAYYGRAMAGGGLGNSLMLFVLRGIVSPFAHPLFTSMTGIGLGVAQMARRGSPLKLIMPVVGICMAMFLHFLWNLSASFGTGYFFIAYVLIMIPALLGVIAMVIISLRKEGKLLRMHLAPELQNGLLDHKAYESLCSVSGRLGEAFAAMTKGGFGTWRTRTQFHDVATDLAFHRWRTARGIIPRHQTPAEREAAYLQRLRELRSRLA